MATFRSSLVRQLENAQAKLTPLSTEMFWQLYDEFLALEKRVATYDEKLRAIARAHPVCQRVQTIPGIGPLTTGLADTPGIGGDERWSRVGLCCSP